MEDWIGFLRIRNVPFDTIFRVVVNWSDFAF